MKAHTERQTVLVVEHDPASQGSAAAVLASAGHSVTAVNSFDEGRSILESTPPALLVTDVRLGRYNGLQLVLHQFFADPRNPSILIDDRADDMTRSEAQRHGADYIVRPFVAAELVTLAEARLACGPAEQKYGARRRWARREPPSGVTVMIDGNPARLVNAGYGGLRIEMDGPHHSLDPGGFAFRIGGWPFPLRGRVTWEKQVAGTRQCGMLVTETEFEPLSLWKQSVDGWS